MNTQTEPTPRERIEQWMTAHRVTVEADFVPYSQSRNAKPGDDGKPWPSLNWRVRVMVQPQAPGGKARELLATDYSAGSGHTPASKAGAAKIKRAASALGRSDSVARAAMIEWEIENGKVASGAHHGGFSGREPILPDACDVLYSLASDSDVLRAGGFEAWAAEFGYDTDSRKAEATYKACLETALKLRAGLGEDALRDLRAACQDY